MTSYRDRQAEFRRQKRAEGFTESNIWLSPQDKLVLEREASKSGLSKNEVIRLALRKAFSEEHTTQ